MPKKGSTAVKVTFMTMTLVTLVTAVKFDYGTVQAITHPGFGGLGRQRYSLAISSTISGTKYFLVRSRAHPALARSDSQILWYHGT